MYMLNFCYLCLCNDNNLKSILIEDVDGIVMEKKLKFCLSGIIDLKPEISKYICNICLENVNFFYSFKQTCLRNKKKINKYLRNMIIDADSHKQISLQTLLTHNTNLQVANNSKILQVQVTTQPSTAKQEDPLPEKRIDAIVKEDQVDEIMSPEFVIVHEEPADIEDALPIHQVDVMDLDTKEESPLEDHSQINNKLLNNLKDETESNVQKKSKKVSTFSQNETGFECAVCKETFASKKRLRRHKRRHRKRLTCKYCNKKLSSNSSLRKHERIHLGIENYHCSICNESFLEKFDFLSHKKIHMDSKDYECVFCQKKFSQNDHLRLHKKDFQCTICKKKRLYKKFLEDAFKSSYKQ